jgi:rhodanese-related sulfurtransferase
MNSSITLFYSLILAVFLISDSYAIDGQTMFKEVNDRVKTIDSISLKQMVDNKEKFVLMDIRMPSEIKRMGKIDAIQNKELPRGWLELRVSNLVPDKKTPIVTYCGGGVRSAFAADTLTKMGYSNVKNYKQGFMGWEDKGYPAKYE